ncbi:hypothetical protein G7Y82_01255 [Solimonas sp. C16B3]|uniref:Uncharacterized protein n=1 Tax=Solimonas marina TaxID=2714601 RepID=A0A969W6R1_9GAMM|nr:hypothetical protein [Solimonas marina]
MKRMNKTTSTRITTLWLALNAAGAGLFLLFASAAWVEPEIRQYPGAAGGGAVIAVLGGAPLLALYTLANAGLFIWAVVVRMRRSYWPISAWCWASLPMWVGVVIFSRSHM